MKKQSLVYVHGLLVHIRHELQRCGEIPTDAYREYDEQSVSQLSIHRSKGAHREAIGLLGEGILRTIDHQCDENELTRSDRSLPANVDDWELPDQ